MGLEDVMGEFPATLAQAKEGLAGAVPNILLAGVVLIVGWGLALALRRIVRGAFQRVAAEDQRAGSIAATGFYWLILLSAALGAIDALQVPVFSRWMGTLLAYLPRFAIAVALVLGGVVIGRLARSAIVKTATRMPASQARKLGRFAQVSIVVAATLIAAGQLGLDVSLLTSVFLIVLAAALGAAALAFGVGAREVTADILAMHYVNRSYRIGQRVRVGSEQGRILRTTRTTVVLESVDGELSIPGRSFSSSSCVLLSEDDDSGS
jgi:small-conductance mechanosensitive channel